MSNINDIRKHLHSASGALAVIETFVQHVDTSQLTPELKELHQAALRSLEKIKTDFSAAHELVSLLPKP